MNHFLLEREDRLDHWKKFRSSLPDLSEAEQLSAVARYWALAPLMKCAYDSALPDTWPGPWEMIMAGDWCRDSVAIGMEFTLRLSGWDKSRLSLVMIRDYDISDEMLTLKIDNEYLLNYSIGEVTEYPTTKHNVLAQFVFNSRGYSSLK